MNTEIPGAQSPNWRTKLEATYRIRSGDQDSVDRYGYAQQSRLERPLPPGRGVVWVRAGSRSPSNQFRRWIPMLQSAYNVLPSPLVLGEVLIKPVHASIVPVISGSCKWERAARWVFSAGASIAVLHSVFARIKVSASRAVPCRCLLWRDGTRPVRIRCCRANRRTRLAASGAAKTDHPLGAAAAHVRRGIMCGLANSIRRVLPCRCDQVKAIHSLDHSYWPAFAECADGRPG